MTTWCDDDLLSDECNSRIVGSTVTVAMAGGQIMGRYDTVGRAEDRDSLEINSKQED